MSHHPAGTMRPFQSYRCAKFGILAKFQDAQREIFAPPPGSGHVIHGSTALDQASKMSHHPAGTMRPFQSYRYVIYFSNCPNLMHKYTSKFPYTHYELMKLVEFMELCAHGS
ncbi:hypothetical protein Ddc_22726 [Ditylenchus destructor]|nr:hypothetical protein Ddc_22726 [Ditylenchus destructor]